MLMSRLSALRFAICLLLLLAPLQSAYGWHAQGHRAIAGGAVQAASATLPAFFTAGIASVEDASIEPDRQCDHQYRGLREVERPEHYIDLELLQGRPLPESRRAYVELCRELGVKPWHAGTAPYAIVEAVDRLTIALARHRQRPDDLFIQAQCLHYAGMLAHYTADVVQPLHTTIHFNGRARPDGSSPATGIHGAVDGLQDRFRIPREQLLTGVTPQVVASPWQRTLAQLMESHGQVDHVYSLDLRQMKEPSPSDDGYAEVRTFTEQRLRQGVAFTADLLVTAWARSAQVEIPAWDRPPQE